MLNEAFTGKVVRRRKGNKGGPYDKIFRVVLALLISLNVDRIQLCHAMEAVLHGLQKLFIFFPCFTVKSTWGREKKIIEVAIANIHEPCLPELPQKRKKGKKAS